MLSHIKIQSCNSKWQVYDLLLILAIISFSRKLTQASYLQQPGNGIIAGEVRSEGEGEALTGANVIIEGTRHGAATDIDGRLNRTQYNWQLNRFCFYTEFET